MGPRFSPALFDALLSPGGVGQNALWRRASLCPCRDPYSGQAEQGCPQCAGRGVSWGQGSAVHAGVVGQKSARRLLDATQIENGDQLLSVPGASPLRDAGEFDLVVMLDSSKPYALVLQRDGTEKVDPSTHSIERCFWLNPGDRAEVEGGIPSVAPGTGALSWADPATAPPMGVQFSLRGRRRPTYFVFGTMPQDRAHGGGLPLPRKIVVRLFDLFGR